MPVVKPPAPKHTTQDLGDKLVINIPSPRHWFLAIFQALVLAMLVSVELAVIFLLISFAREPDPSSGFFFFLFLIMAIFWTMGFAIALYGFLWQLFGKEMIQATERSITITRAIFGTGSPKEYLAGSIKDLRLTPSSSGDYLARVAWMFAYRLPMSSSTARLAFDYGAKTFRFGSGIDEVEAKQIVAEIQQKFPQYRGNGFSPS